MQAHRHRELIAIAKELGWFVERVTRKGSIILRHTITRARCTVASTPSCHHAYRNNLARLRRLSDDKRQAG